jgi:hypothetical protein
LDPIRILILYLLYTRAEEQAIKKEKRTRYFLVKCLETTQNPPIGTDFCHLRYI